MKYPAGISGEEYAAMEDGYQQGYAAGLAARPEPVSALGMVEQLGRVIEAAAEQCRCGHAPEQHDDEADPFLCTVCGDNTHCNYADDALIAADRWDEGYITAVGHLCPSILDESDRLLWALDHMPRDNPYREESP